MVSCDDIAMSSEEIQVVAIVSDNRLIEINPPFEEVQRLMVIMEISSAPRDFT